MDGIVVHHNHLCSFDIALGLYKNQFEKIWQKEITNWGVLIF
jgi:ABC-type phosphate transport system substrate-binding protein